MGCLLVHWSLAGTPKHVACSWVAKQACSLPLAYYLTVSETAGPIGVGSDDRLARKRGCVRHARVKSVHARKHASSC